jgi:hypothetical protein
MRLDCVLFPETARGHVDDDFENRSCWTDHHARWGKLDVTGSRSPFIRFFRNHSIPGVVRVQAERAPLVQNRLDHL